MKIAVGCDHAAVEHKNDIRDYLIENGFDVTDFGINENQTIDYPVIAKQVALCVSSNECELGILVCGTGIGMSLAANKVKGIRAAACSEHFSAKYTRLHNDSNILCLGARVIGVGTAIELVDLFVNTKFEGGRHQRRVDMITDIENN